MDLYGARFPSYPSIKVKSKMDVTKNNAVILWKIITLVSGI